MNENFNQNAINPGNENMNNEQKTTNTFNLIIGIATLLIAILGSTFAYFSATARSAENDVTVKSAFVSISYDGGTEIKASNLIPASLNVALKKYQKEIYSIDENTGLSVIQPFDPEKDIEINEDYDNYNNKDINRKCVDSKGKQVCYVYQFSIESDGVENETTDILASIKINKNQFDNLSFALYEVDLLEENGEVVTDKYGIDIIDVSEYGKGYQLAYLNPELKKIPFFAYKDTNEDNGEVADIKFDKFVKPFDLIGENQELVGSVNPVVCLFGYKNENYIEEYETDLINVNEIATGDIKALSDKTERCAPYPLKNKEKHTYQLLIWLEETGEEQPEQGMIFEGTVSIEVSGGSLDIGDYENGQITGKE